jgi:branched-subunit amino acid aminotransferase/4-amino-4-deoxychorismate lyase
LLEFGPLPSDIPGILRVSQVRVDSRDRFLYHKTTRRGLYEAAREGCSSGEDVLLVNERNEVTEMTIANVAVFRGTKWVTPQISCGLLPGVMRAELLADGEIAEGVVRVDDLISGERIRCFNALRGVFEASLQS